ncbi:hypothetical protein [Rhizobium sp. S163]|uniref:hypothetical protein n=1 Tax=Rhizobium sp. S163 TaxID=3055039 RepID=UPI00339D6C8F
MSPDTRVDALTWLAKNRPDLAVVDPRLIDGLCMDVVEVLAKMKISVVAVESGERS